VVALPDPSNTAATHDPRPTPFSTAVTPDMSEENYTLVVAQPNPHSPWEWVSRFKLTGSTSCTKKTRPRVRSH
jgi:hypothetical protein